MGASLMGGSNPWLACCGDPQWAFLHIHPAGAGCQPATNVMIASTMYVTSSLVAASCTAVLLSHQCTAWLQDGIRVEFEEQLPMREYALRIPL